MGVARWALDPLARLRKQARDDSTQCVGGKEAHYGDVRARINMLQNVRLEVILVLVKVRGSGAFLPTLRLTLTKSGLAR